MARGISRFEQQGRNMQVLASGLFIAAASLLYFGPDFLDRVIGDVKIGGYDVGSITAAVFAGAPIVIGTFFAMEGVSRNGKTVYPRGPGEKNDMA